MIRFLTAGESHGKALVGIIEGLPANLNINVEKINYNLAKRQAGYGRGGRMKIETDTVKILSGVRNGKTIGSPVALKIENKDWENWQEAMDVENVKGIEEFTKPRPGHADLSGAIKYNQTDIRNILERASARETAIRVAIGSVCEQFLEVFGIKIYSHVIQIGKVKSNVCFDKGCYEERMKLSVLRCFDENAEKEMITCIDRAKEEGDSVGGIFEIIVSGVPIGLGSHVHWDRKLDGKIAGGLMSIQAIKGIEFGMGFNTANANGSDVHDEIIWNEGKGYSHKTNKSGGIEGGMTNGEDIIVRAVMKPIPTLYKPLQTVNMKTKEVCEASVERSDVCAVPAGSIVGQSVVAWEIMSAFMEKFAGDSIDEIKNSF